MTNGTGEILVRHQKEKIQKNENENQIKSNQIKNKMKMNIQKKERLISSSP